MLLSTIFKNIVAAENDAQNSKVVESNNILKNIIITMISNKDYFHFVEKNENNQIKLLLKALLSGEISLSPTETANATKNIDLDIVTSIEATSKTITDYKKLILIDGTEVTLDINFVIRPKAQFVNVDLSKLTDEKLLLSAVTINLPPSINIGRGGCNKIFKSNQQCKYDKENDIFIVKKTSQIKSIRQSTPEYDEFTATASEFSDAKKDIIRFVMGKPENEPRRGVYFLKNSRGQQVSIFPYIEGVVLFELLNNKNTLFFKEFLEKRNLTKEHIALQLALALARLHRLGYMHCDIKPENIIVQNDGSIRFIDPDFFTKMDEVIPFPQGTLQYCPPYALTHFEKTHKVSPYHDIYSTMICMLLVLDSNFLAFFSLFKENSDKNLLNNVLNYFKLTLQNLEDTSLSRLFLPFFSNPESANPEALINQLLCSYPEQAKYAINAITKDDPKSSSMLESKLESFNQGDGYLFIEYQKHFLDYIINLLIQNQSFSECDFLNKQFLFPNKKNIDRIISELHDKILCFTRSNKRLSNPKLVKIIATYLTNGDTQKTSDITNIYSMCSTSRMLNKKNQPDIFTKALCDAFLAKKNSGDYDHDKFLKIFSFLSESTDSKHKLNITSRHKMNFFPSKRTWTEFNNSDKKNDPEKQKRKKNTDTSYCLVMEQSLPRTP